MSTLNPAEIATLERLLARQPADRERVLPIDALQCELTEKYIVPNLPQLEAEFLEIRQTVDAKMRRRMEQATADAPLQAGSNYPKGFCLPITVLAAAEFEARGSSKPSTAAKAVAAFRRAGGHVTKVWGVLRNQYFQNALQFGSIYFDVANDTVDVNKPKVEYMPMAESGFKNIESYEEFADVAERYWKCRMFPNLHFPRLAPLLPMLKLSASGVLSLESSIYYMQRMNVDSGFQAGEQFVTASRWRERRLPGEWLDHVQDYKREHLSSEVGTAREGVAAEDIVRLCREYRASAVYTSRPFLTRVLASARNIKIELQRPPASTPA